MFPLFPRKVLFFPQLEINERKLLSDEEMKEERFVLFTTQIFFSPINKN